MHELARQNNVYIRKEVSKADAVQYFTEKGDEYKLDLLQNLEDGNITFIHRDSLPISAAGRTFRQQDRSKQ